LREKVGMRGNRIIKLFHARSLVIDATPDLLGKTESIGLADETEFAGWWFTG